MKLTIGQGEDPFNIGLRSWNVKSSCVGACHGVVTCSTISDVLVKFMMRVLPLTSALSRHGSFWKRL